MKLLILTGNYPRKNALNYGIFIHQQVKALQQLGVECHVLLLYNWFPPLGLHKYHPYWQQGYDKKVGFFDNFEGVTIHHMPMFVRMPARLFNETYFDQAERAIIKYVTGHKQLRDAKLMYAHFLTDIGYIAARVKDELGLQLATIARGDDVHAWPEQDPALRDNLLHVFEKADILLANSGRLAADTQKWMLPGKKREVKVVYNGVNTAVFKPASSKAEIDAIKGKFGLAFDTRYLLCVATPVALKGWNELLDAVKALENDMNGWKLLMVAPKRDYHDAIDLMAKGADMGISHRLRYIPGLPPAELAEVMRACDAFVLPSYNEGMANALLEAMASGLPPIATDVGGHSEVITQGEDGMLVPPRTADELTMAIRNVINDDTLRNAMAVKARERMIRFGDYLQNGKRLLDIFEQHLNTRTGHE